MQNNALVNGVLSFIIPGVGQYLNDEKQKATTLFIFMLVLHAAIYYVANNPLGSGISTLYHLYAGWDAYKNY